MKINSLVVKNYRTLEDCIFNFPDNYCAISGKNNAGKSNLIKALRIFFFDNDGFYGFGDDTTISHKKDLPQWITGKQHQKSNIPQITFNLHIKIYNNVDSSLFLYIQKFLEVGKLEEEISLDFGLIYDAGKSEPIRSLVCNGITISDEFKIEDAHRKLKTSDALVFYNSTKNSPYLNERMKIFSFAQTLTADDEEKLKKHTDRVFSTLNSVAKKHKSDISLMLGRLQEKYTVNIGIPALDFDDLPLRISLGNKTSDIPLDDWGSGTQNRTQILLALLNARKASQRDIDSKKISPVVVIEEPESFLHPSAQAEFGAILRDLSKEFGLQLLVATHSPHMLSCQLPTSNILLERKNNNRTEIVDTSGPNWMQPFAMALGINSDSFGDWRDIIFSNTEEIILVEGEIDKDYLLDLKHEKHGVKRLVFEGDIFAYGGEGFLSNELMVKFILGRFSKVLVTYDLDFEVKNSQRLDKLGLKKNEDHISVGLNIPGKKCIEGLLPNKILSVVAEKNSDTFSHALTNEEGSKSARQKIKRLKQEEFFKTCVPGSSDYEGLYTLARSIERCLSRKKKAAC